MQRITPGPAWPLHDSDTTRRMETLVASTLPPHTLMQRAGLSSARLALALAPHAQTIWLLCGPGNNGGDGLQAAVHLQQWGKRPVVSFFGPHGAHPEDAAAALHDCRQAGVQFALSPPMLGPGDLCVDALLGLGQRRALAGDLAEATRAARAQSTPVLALDVPTGLCSDTGRDLNADTDRHAGAPSIVAAHTLSLLTLKPGLFTAHGRALAGQVWFDDLGVASDLGQASAWLSAAPGHSPAPHTAHKGNRGSVWIVAGAPGMRGAARLAARAALHAGVGKVHLQWLLPEDHLDDPVQPEILFPTQHDAPPPDAALLCGCGGGDAVVASLPRALAHPGPLVLDADGLNAVARDESLKLLLRRRGQRQRVTVLTPHPLEAARLLGCSTAHIQADRLGSARQLARVFDAVAVLKGSGTVIAAPQGASWINPTGNGRLAQAGTGDVLAGMVCAELALGRTGEQAACGAVFRHGQAADLALPGEAFGASQLASAFALA